ADLLAKTFLSKESDPDITGAIHLLSRREKEIFYSLLQGLPPEEIAEFLNISVKTVSSHKSNIFQKFHIRTDYELFRLGLAIGYYS
ncbi:MAG: helix-turn-helix transcriptional regulator, partial [Sphaerochaetaceae bacterium]|nr:helix-turn-helix transcriptional regulator [Sphaerochaetaceae bacterium]